MPSAQDSQKARLKRILNARKMMHAHELREVGISAQTIARAVESGEDISTSIPAIDSASPLG